MPAGTYNNNTTRLVLAGLFLVVVFLAALTGNVVFLFLPVAIVFAYAGWQAPRFIFFLLLMALPFSFEYNFNPGLSTDIPDEFLMLFVSFLFVSAFAFQPRPVLALLHHPLVQLCLLCFSWMIIPAIFSTHPFISFKFLMAKGWYAGAFLFAPLVFCSDRSSIQTSARIFLVALFTVVLIIMVKHGMNGFRFATINDAVSPFFRNHVNYSAMLVCSLPMMIGIYAGANSKQKKWIAVAIVIVVLPALALAYSRGAWLALGAGMIAWWTMKKRQLVTLYIACLLISIAALGWLTQRDHYLDYAHDYRTTIFHSNFSEHLQATYQMKDISAAERFHRWVAAVRMTADKPVTGFGPGTFYNNYQSYTVPAFKTWVSNNPERSTAHNYFLLTASEQGIPGLMLLLVLLGACLWYAQRLYHSCSDKLYKSMSAVAGIMLIMIIVLNLLSDLIETDKIGSLFFLSIAMLVIAGRNQSRFSDTPANVKSIS